MTNETVTLTENHVVDAVCDYLDRAGWIVEIRRSTTERGADIVARGSEQTLLLVEAKGATSSKPGTARHGRPFSRAQIASHVARAFYTAAASLDKTDVAGRVVAAMALPETKQHRESVEKISPALEQLGIGVFWVTARDRVRLDAPWRLCA